VAARRSGKCAAERTGLCLSPDVVNQTSGRNGMMQVMSVPPRVIPISAEAPAPAVGCSACVAAAAAEVRGIDANGTAPAPMLSGSPAHVQHLLHCVESALAEAGAASPNLVSALRVNDDEAELDLAVAPRCGGAILADAAFQALRRELPDTDIYVRTLLPSEMTGFSGACSAHDLPATASQPISA